MQNYVSVSRLEKLLQSKILQKKNNEYTFQDYWFIPKKTDESKNLQFFW